MTIKLLNGVSSTQMLQAVLPICEIVSFNEVVPSMNDIFIRKVNEGNEALGTKSNYTE
jgi:ABC-2 type transport system ATP-binding protein